MRVEKLTIYGYRNFEEFEIEFDDFTLIIGENNIGKSNLLNALCLIFSSDISFSSRRNLDLSDINFNSVIYFKKQIIDLTIPYDNLIFPEVKIEAVLGGFDANQEAIVGDWFTGSWNTDSAKNKAKVTYLFNNKEDLKEWVENQRNALSSLSKEEDESTDDFEARKLKYVDFPISYYDYIIYGGDDSSKLIDYRLLKYFKMDILDALRDAKTDLLASSNNTLLYKILLDQTDSNLKDIKDQLIQLKETIQANNQLDDLKFEIQTYLDQISLNGDNSSVDFEFSQFESSEMLKKLSLIYGAEPIAIHRNGLGKNNLLYISLVLSHLIKKANSKLRVYFRIVGIEEPEAHLHPHLQETLATNFRNEANGDVQIITTSHSTHITSKLPLNKTIVLYREKGKIKPYYLVKKIPDESKIYLQKYLDATKSTMFFARKLILVEGISEQLLIPTLFQLYTGRSIEKLGCNIINVNGVAFKHFLETIKAGYFIKCGVITDSDSNKGGNSSQRAKDLKAKYDDGEHIKITITQDTLSTFEKELIDANRTGKGKEIILEALVKTRPRSGKNLKDGLGTKAIDTESVFNLIEVKDKDGNKTADHKSEFAINLFEILSNDAIAAQNFVIPDYLKECFEFMNK